MIRATLRPHQESALSNLRASLLAGFRRPMLCAPTGAGKTVIGAALIDAARSKGRRALFCVPALALIDQTVDRFMAEGITDIGVIQADHPLTDPDQPVQIASVQTLMRRKIPNVDLVIIDEAHRWFEFFERWFMDPSWKSVPFIGLSATPGTKGLGKWFNNLITVATTEELIEKGYLSRFKVYAPSHPDLSKVKIKQGEYDDGELSEVMSHLTADVVETWLAKGERRPTLCFAVDRVHAKHLQTQFEAAGVRTGYVDAFSTSDERKKLEYDFAQGHIEVVCNVGVLTTGIDWDVRCLILARPTRSKMLFVQIVGRGLRTADETTRLGKKDHCLILDHSDNHLRLGFVTDIHWTELDDGTKAKKEAPEGGDEPLPKECPSCHFLRPPKVKVCPACGFEAAPKSEVVCEDGELVEITPRKKSGLPSREEQQRWLSMLMHMGLAKGKAPGWATGKFYDKFKVWPNGLDKESVLEPNDEVRGFVQHTNIRFARGKKKAS